MLNFENPETVSLNHRYEFWGDVFNYRNIQTVTVQGTYLSNAQNGISDIWNQISSGINQSDFDDILLEGVSFGSGRLLSISFDNGVDVREKRYNATFEVYKDGNLFNISGEYYSGLVTGFAAINLKNIQTISETFAFTKTQNNVSYKRDLSLDIIDDGTFSVTGAAKNIAKILFNTNPVIQFATQVYPSFYLNNGFKKYNEKYDLINGRFSFSEDFVSAGNENYYIWEYGNVFQMAENGIVNVSENGSLVGLTGSLPIQKWHAAENGYLSISSNVYDRVTGIYYPYLTFAYPTGTGCPSLYLQSKTVSSDQCKGSVSYSFEYTNDWKFANYGFYHEYTHSLSRNDVGFYEVAEQGAVQSYSHDRTQKYYDSLSGFNSISGGIRLRVGTFYSGSVYELTNGIRDGVESRSLKNTSAERTYSENAGNVSYNYKFSDDPYLIDNDLFVRAEHTIDNDEPTHNFNKFNIFNYKEIAQPSYQTKLGTFVNNFTIQGKDVATLNDYLNYCNGRIRFPENAIDAFISDAQYSYTPNSNQFSLSVTYNYTRYREPGDIIIW